MGTQYFYAYELCALFFLLVTSVFFFLSRRLPGRLNKAFGAMLLLTLASLALNVATVLADNRSQALPLALLYLLNIAYLITVCSSLAAFFGYVYLITSRNRQIPLPLALLCLLPISVLVLILLTTPWNNLIFYFNADNSYRQGPWHSLISIVCIFYILATICQIVQVRRLLGRKILRTAWTLAVLMIAAIVIQYLQPRYLLTGMAGALCLQILYLAWQSPNDYLDASTGLFNRMALPYLTEMLYNKKREFGVLVYLFRDMNAMTLLQGMEFSRQVLFQFIRYAQSAFSGSYIVRLDSNQFLVLLPDTRLDQEKLARISEDAPRTWQFDGQQFQLALTLLGLTSANHPHLCAMMNSYEQSLQLIKTRACRQTLFVDDDLAAAGREAARVEGVLRDKLAQDRIELAFQPIFSLEKNCFVAAEALARLYDEDSGYIPPALFIPIAERTGLIHQLTEVLLHKICAFLTTEQPELYGLTQISVNLSAQQCQNPDLAARISGILSEYQVPASMLCFEITESTASRCACNIKRVMQDLGRLGASFALDDFGIGYANLDSVINLPFNFAKIDKSLLWSAGMDLRKEALLRNVINIFSSLGICTICEGAETIAHIGMLKANGVDMIQGFYYARPLSPQQLLHVLQEQSPDLYEKTGADCDISLSVS